MRRGDLRKDVSSLLQSDVVSRMLCCDGGLAHLYGESAGRCTPQLFSAVLSCPEERNTQYLCTPMCPKLMLLPVLLVLPVSFAGLVMAMWTGLGAPSLFLLCLAESLQDGELTWEQTLQ